MLCRLYDTREKRYIVADETMDYSVHPVGAVLHLGAEDHRIIAELSTQRFDINEKEVFVGDIIKAKVRGTSRVVEGAVCFYPKYGIFGIEVNGDACRSNSYRSSRVYTWESFGLVEITGNIHDDEMEAL